MRYDVFLSAVFLLTVCMISQVIGDLTSIRPGGTVFLGEERLDITASGVIDGDQIGWWAPGSKIMEEPTELVTISSPDSFYVSPSQFDGKEGLWYTWPGKNPVFNVKNPKISVRVYDETSDFDATGKWVPRGDSIGFRISSNVYEANSRGGTDGQVDIVLTSPQGGKYSSVSGPSGSFSLEGIPLTSSLTSTGPVWSTGGEDSGTWKIRGEVSMNRIKDNLPDIGEGVSETIDVLIQNENPLIKKDVAIQVGEIPSEKITPAQATTRPTKKPTPPITPVVTTPTPVPQVNTTPVQTVTTVLSTPSPTPEPTVLQTTAQIQTQAPVPTRSPAGIITVLGAVLIIFLVRRTYP